MRPSAGRRRVSASRPWPAAPQVPSGAGEATPLGPRTPSISGAAAPPAGDGGISLLRPGPVPPAASPELGGGSRTQTFLLSYFIKGSVCFRDFREFQR